MSHDIYDTIRKLVDWTAPPGTLVLSLYLDISPGQQTDALDFARERCRALIEEHADDQAFADAVGALLERLPEHIGQARQRDYDGLAVFCSGEPPLDEHLALRFAFESQAQVGRDPFLRHLLYYAEEYERAVCVVLDPPRAWVCEINIGDRASVREITASDRRDLAGELTAALARTVRDQPEVHVVLLGRPDGLEALERRLSQDVSARIIDRIDRPIAPSSPEFLRTVHRSLQAYERRAEAAGVTELLHPRDDRAEVAIGVADTLGAINRGKVKVLYLMQDFGQRGWLCDVCDYLGPLPAPPACIACGATVSEVCLEEHVSDQAAACGAEIETVFESEQLRRAGGIGCLIDDGRPEPRRTPRG